MNVRSFEWRDLPALHRYRAQCLYLDHVRVLTRGPIIAPTGAVLSSFSSASGIFTYLAAEQAGAQPYLIGQVMHEPGQGSARLTFLAPDSLLSIPLLSGIIEMMAIQIGERGGLRILAEVAGDHPLFEGLRQVGFGVYARQRIWELPTPTAAQALPGLRRAQEGADMGAIRFLYANLVPGLIQQVESPPVSRTHGLVLYRGNELVVFVEIHYGASGIWVQPFVHPEAETVAEPLMRTLQNLPYRRSRPVYVCVRSYQSWLEPIIEGLGAAPSAPQAVLVRHLSLARRQSVANAVVVLNGKTAEPTLPIVR
ncbi:MAG: hypothetical protein MUC85_00680 [Anaerolineales bacterium]|jgi:hypothetical protein|nr:hypothetical protein [Anaerolineales bacterium]